MPVKSSGFDYVLQHQVYSRGGRHRLQRHLSPRERPIFLQSISVGSRPFHDQTEYARRKPAFDDRQSFDIDDRALLASGHIRMRRINGWHSFAKPVAPPQGGDHPVALAA